MSVRSFMQSPVALALLMIVIMVTFSCMPASSESPMKLDLLKPYELSETQVYKILSSNDWKSRPRVGTKFSIIEQKTYGNEATYTLTFGADLLECSIEGAKDTRFHHWSFKKVGPNGGWVLLKNGGALSLFLFRDGTMSLCGRRYFPWTKKSAFEQCKNHVVPGDTFTKLTAGSWVQPNDFNGGPCTLTMGRDGTFAEIRNGKHVEHKHFWSLNSIFKPQFVVHDFDEFGSNNCWSLGWKGADLLLNGRTLVRQTASQPAGLLYGDYLGNLNFKLTYQRPLRDKKVNRLHFEFTRSAAGGAFSSEDGLDKINVNLTMLNKETLKKASMTSRVFDLKGMPAKGQTKTADLDFVFDKSMRTEIDLFVAPGGIYKSSTAERLVYDPDFRHWYEQK